MLPHPHGILSAPYHTYTPTFPYRYASNRATPCQHPTILMLPHPNPILSTIDHAYAPAAPSIYDSDPATSSLHLPTPIPNALCHPQCPKYMPPTPQPHVCFHPSLPFFASTPCHTYSPAAPYRYYSHPTPPPNTLHHLRSEHSSSAL
ncbi:hypothetical protein O181_011234 [Austropuccinia psidii MF-1]|uniref:Uncharacterized protein n=1 Tax=Austropuccinia psidii MF-1 TaxID=1389203 RepID=A0A9Q3GLN2_9BASI|nr:hypothetical protein [Austropuccinia psidii MF-1]